MQRLSQFGGMLIRGENHVLFHSATSSMQLHRSHSPVCAACTDNVLHLVLYIRRFFCYKGFPFFHSESLVGLQYILDKHKKGKRDRVSYAKVELPHHNSAKGDHIPHEQEYNTRHGVSAIADEVCREIRR